MDTFENRQTQIPAVMPQGVVIRHVRGSGHSGVTLSYKIEDGRVIYEESNSILQSKKGWAAKISPAENESIYQIFVRNRFDLIENAKRAGGIVFDAGDTSIYLEIGGEKTYRVSASVNYPVAEEWAENYAAITKALFDLFEKCEKQTLPENRSHPYYSDAHMFIDNSLQRKALSKLFSGFAARIKAVFKRP